MQWLRHTRFEPPSVVEQQQDMRRQEQMKMLAQQADERWASKPSALDSPDKQQPMQMLQSRDPESGVVQTNIDQETRDRAEPPRNLEEQQARPQPVLADAASQQMPQDPPVPAITEDTAAAPRRKKAKKEPQEDSPWKQADASKEWQPQGWSPAPTRRG
jgi:NADH dehydrogenase [ubiquinone] 1 alpha subcomplex assembly factor 2